MMITDACDTYWTIDQQQPGRRGQLVWCPKGTRGTDECPTAEAAVADYRAWLAERPWLPQDLPVRARLRSRAAILHRALARS